MTQLGRAKANREQRIGTPIDIKKGRPFDRPAEDSHLRYSCYLRLSGIGFG